MVARPEAMNKGGDSSHAFNCDTATVVNSTRLPLTFSPSWTDLSSTIPVPRDIRRREHVGQRGNFEAKCLLLVLPDVFDHKNPLIRGGNI